MMKKPTYQELENEVLKLKNELNGLKEQNSAKDFNDIPSILRSITDGVQDMILLCIDTNYRYLYFNDLHKQVMQTVYGVDVVLGMNILDCITIGADRQKAKENYDKAFANIPHSNIQDYGEAKYYYESFFSPLLSCDNKIIGATGLALNVSDREKSKLLLKESEAKHKALISNIGDVIGIVGSDGVMHYKSSNVEKIFGWKPEELIGLDAFVNVHPDDLKQVKAVFFKLLKEEHASIKFEFRYRQKNMQYTWVELYAVNGLNNPHINGILINYHDISARKTLDKAFQLTEHSINKVSDSIFWIDESSKIVFVNDAVCTKLGYTREELLQRDVFDLDPEFPRHKWKEHWEQIKEKGSFIIETKHKTKDGLAFPVEVTTNLITYDGKLYNCAIARDISERIYAQKVLQKREHEYSTTLNGLLIGVVLHDKDSRVLYCNPKASALLGLSVEQMKGKEVIDPAWNFVHEDLTKASIENYPISKVMASQQALKNYVLGIKRPDLKEITWVEVNAVPMFGDDGLLEKVVVNFNDITEKKLAEEKLIEREHTFRALFEKGPIGVAYHKMIYDEYGNPENYLFLEANESYQKLTGVNPNGKLVTEAFPGIENDPFNWIGTFGEVARTGKEIRFQQYLEPNDRWYDCVGYQYKQDHFVAAFLEITEQKRAEMQLKENQDILKTQNEEYLVLNEELNEKNLEYASLNENYKNQKEAFRKAKEKAEESDHLKTAFLQNMSHEIRTPMNAICGFSEMLTDVDITPEKRSNFITIIQNSSDQLLAIVNDILTISAVETRQEKTNIQKTNINNIIVELQVIFNANALNQKLSLYSKQGLSDRASEIYTDKTKVTQILTNLLSNALKFTQEGTIEFGYNLKGDVLEFFVKDNGIGINQESYDKIFDRFRQADKTIQDNYGGTGLGLAISKAFVELLSGKIWVESEMGVGSTFYFTLPYKPVEENSNVDIVKEAEKRGNTILVAEDEVYNFIYIKEVLSGMDVSIIHAKNGQEAVEHCQLNDAIDLVLMDIKMPVLNGFEAAKQIKKFRPNLKIIAQSAFALESEIELFKGNAFDEYITKPIKADFLKQVVEGCFKVD